MILSCNINRQINWEARQVIKFPSGPSSFKWGEKNLFCCFMCERWEICDCADYFIQLSVNQRICQVYKLSWNSTQMVTWFVMSQKTKQQIFTMKRSKTTNCWQFFLKNSDCHCQWFFFNVDFKRKLKYYFIYGRSLKLKWAVDRCWQRDLIFITQNVAFFWFF